VATSTSSGAHRDAPMRALRDQERERHRAHDYELVGNLQEATDDSDLVGDLGAAEHGDQ